MSLEDKVRWVNRKNKGKDPLQFFREHYNPDTNRTQLAREDSSLYRILSRRELLDEAIPEFDQKASERGKVGGSAGTRDFGDDPVAYYKKHYDGLTRGQLHDEDRTFYDRLGTEGLLEHVPLKKR